MFENDRAFGDVQFFGQKTTQSGIRFPQNPCTTCPFVGLCLNQHELAENALLRKPGVDFGVFDELAY